MSVSYIVDLSSDEEVEIISEKRLSNKPIHENAICNKETTALSNAVDRLQRNTNIELTIDLDKNVEDKLPTQQPQTPSLLQNLLASVKSQLKELLEKVPPQKESKFSEDVIIIDHDEQDPIEEPKKNNKIVPQVPSVNEKSKNTSNQSTTNPCFSKKNVQTPNILRKNSDAEQLCEGGLKTPNQSETSKVIVENGNEIFIIDDDDDDDLVLSVPNGQLNTPRNSVSIKDQTQKRSSENKLILSVKKSPKKSPTPNLLETTLSPPATPVTTKSNIPPVPVSITSTPLISLPGRSTVNLSQKRSCPSILDDVIILDEPSPKKEECRRELRPRRSTSETERDPLTSKQTPQTSQAAAKPAAKPAKSAPVSNGPSSEQSTSKAMLPQVNLTRIITDTPSPAAINKYSVENMFDGLVKVSCKIFQDENLGTKFWKYFRSASEDIVKSEQFLKALKVALKSAEGLKNPTQKDKESVMRNLKDVIKILKRQPERVNKTLRKLNKMLELIHERIRKLEEMEVTSSSDEESENVYVLLDRHRTRAAKIYSKICELEGKAAHAGRATLQKFHFSGSSGYAKIEHALEKFFDKTKQFPDFQEVKRLIELTVEREKIHHILPIDIHNIAQGIFLEFGNKLQRMRKSDDYTILVDYLDDGDKDPALDNEELFRKLEENKLKRKKEEEVLAEFTRKQVELRAKGEIKSDEEQLGGKESSASDDESEKEDGGPREKDLQFTDTEDELINDEVETVQRKRKRLEDEESPQSPRPWKRTTNDLDQMEVNLKLVADVQECNGVNGEGSSTDKDHMMDQLGLASKGTPEDRKI